MIYSILGLFVALSALSYVIYKFFYYRQDLKEYKAANKSIKKKVANAQEINDRWDAIANKLRDIQLRNIQSKSEQVKPPKKTRDDQSIN
jgi:uncharacterized membrane protein (DUF106 family)